MTEQGEKRLVAVRLYEDGRLRLDTGPEWEGWQNGITEEEAEAAADALSQVAGITAQEAVTMTKLRSAFS